MTRDNGKYQDLHDWLVTQNGHRKGYGVVGKEYCCGVKAYERMGSIEQLALLRLNVTFDTTLHEKAMGKRLKNKAKEGVTEGRGNWMSFINGKKSN